jgi:hypothetical protein
VIVEDSNATSTQFCSFKRLVICTAISTFENIADIKIDFPNIPGFYSLVNLICIGWRYNPGRYQAVFEALLSQDKLEITPCINATIA